MKNLVWCGIFAGLLFPAVASAQEKLTREQKVLKDREHFESDSSWIYNDFTAALAEAKKTNKPILAVMRCLPCEECVKLDDAVLDSHPTIQKLRDQFVSVRVVSNNGLDLNLFRIDPDQSFGAVIFSPEGKVLARYGTRSHRTEWEDDVSVEGFAATMEGALELFQKQDSIEVKLLGKQPAPMELNQPEKLPGLREKYKSKLEEGPNLVKSCIHCHQVGEAIRNLAWDKSGELKEENLFIYPNPKILGMILDPRTRTMVRRIVAGTPAAKAGVLPGDEIIELGGQAVVSTADIQWALNAVPANGAELPLKINRRGKEVESTLVLSSGWRAIDDISWRASTWELRRVVLGGMMLKNPDGATSKAAKTLEIGHVGRFAPHDRALKAGLNPGDKIVSIDGREDWQRETDVIWHLLQNYSDGKPYDVVVEREGKKIAVKLTLKRT
jgi:serine protease Do